MRKEYVNMCTNLPNRACKILQNSQQSTFMTSTKTILVVDDNKVNRQILNKILSPDYNIIEAENGEIALSILREKKESISVVLLDIIMPVLDGYEVLRQIHQDDFLSKIPVIMVSGQNSEDAEIKALSLGANDYVLKPYKPQIIKHRISNTIYLRETAAFVNYIQNDDLTGVYSKAYFYIQVAEILQNNPQNMYDLICFDVERFKLVNDMYGIKVGDEVLKHIGNILKSQISDQGICGRIGADEFACLIPHRNDYCSKYFTDTLVKLNVFSGSIKLNIILRYGIYVIEDTSTPVNIMCDRACLAKESIKGKYDTYFAFYDDAIRQKLLDEQMIASDMKMALTENQFKVYFQPKYDLKTGEIIGSEALIRWIHPLKGFMRPNEFIPLFEKNGFITNLDIYVWEQCCILIKSWKDNGQPITPISINVSRVDIYNLQLPQLLLSLIQKYELSPKYLHLEITETSYTENPEQLIETISKLKKLGFIIEMDDFGTGYSSLNMLSELPIDIIKLDMRFIQKEKHKHYDRSILSFIISLAKWMDLKVVAEGVETEEQVQLLQ
ncbi:MAG: EAL domain-containing protein, partial [Bacteroidales bacterium]